jgi:hypothetical protein
MRVFACSAAPIGLQAPLDAPARLGLSRAQISLASARQGISGSHQGTTPE